MLLLALLATPTASLPASPWRLQLNLGAVRHEAFAADGVRVSLGVGGDDEARIRIDALRVAGVEYRGVQLVCGGFSWDGDHLQCPRGRLLRDGGGRGERPPLPFSLRWRQGGELDFRLDDVDAAALSPLLKRLRAWRPQGRVDLQLSAAADAVRLHLTASELSFSDRGGDIVASGVGGELTANAWPHEDGWRWRAAIDWSQGELAWRPWRRAGGVRIAASGRLDAALLDVDMARLDVAGVGAVNASLLWDREAAAPRQWGLVSERIDLAAAQREWLQPWLQQLGFPEWRSSGKVLFSVEWSDGALQRFYAGLENATVADATGYIVLNGVDAHIPWTSVGDSEAAIEVADARFGDLPLGAFTIPLRSGGDSLSIENLNAPLLDGRFDIERLQFSRRQEGWLAEFSGGLEDVSMAALSRRLGWPQMQGRLSARIPRIALDDNVLEMDGALGVEVFDGGLIVHQLRIRDPFSAQRRVQVDVNALDLDLGMLTRTFSFGAIAGRFDISLNDLELQGWRPLRFDARINSSAGDHPRLLSLGALQDIAALGEGAAANPLSILPPRSIGGFGYRRIGLGGVLNDNVLVLSGIAELDAPDHIVIMEGGGFPAISIRGYNRRVDWRALVSRFEEILAGREELIIE